MKELWDLKDSAHAPGNRENRTPHTDRGKERAERERERARERASEREREKARERERERASERAREGESKRERESTPGRALLATCGGSMQGLSWDIPVWGYNPV